MLFGFIRMSCGVYYVVMCVVLVLLLLLNVFSCGGILWIVKLILLFFLRFLWGWGL